MNLKRIQISGIRREMTKTSFGSNCICKFMSKTKEESKKPWPTKAVMEQIYEMKLWGDGDTDFYSGEGSHITDIVQPYLEAVSMFLNSFEIPLTVVDLGCGDFNVGKDLVKYTKKYTGVDIVPRLIARNKEKFRSENLEFHSLDIAKDELPVGNCVILRQVLQHLSNTEVQAVVSKLYNYKYVILTEHVPDFDYVPNKDIISGQGIRLKKESGLVLTAPPFNMNPKEAKELCSYDLGEGKGVLVTVVYRMF